MSTWKLEYDNDTGPGDESFWEWWTVTDGSRSFKSEDKAEATWLCDTLNAQSVAVAPESDGALVGSGEAEYSRGVTAGKLEALQYTPEERERYGKWVRQSEEFANLAALQASHDELLEAASESFGVLTEPGMMDVDEWKAWQKRTVSSLSLAIKKAEAIKDLGK